MKERKQERTTESKQANKQVIKRERKQERTKESNQASK
jgi:hypothetical protein